MPFDSSLSFGLQVARGLISGITFNNKFGRNAATVTGDAIWSASTAYVEPASAELCNVVSTDTNDDGSPVGTGARTITITGINELYDIVTETVTLNGTGAVSTVNKYWNIHRAYVLTAGSSLANVGTITITSTASGTPVVGNIAIGLNQTQSTVYMVPRNYTAYVEFPEVNVQNTAANKTVHIGCFKKPFGGVFRIQGDWDFISDSGTNFITHNCNAPSIYEAKSTILFKCIAASDPFTVSVNYDIWLVAD